MNPRRSATLAAAVYPTVVVAGWAFVSLTSAASPRIENSAAVHVVDRLAPSLTASIDATARPQANAPQAIAALGFVAPDTPEVAVGGRTRVKARHRYQTRNRYQARHRYRGSAEPEPRPFVVASLGDPVVILPETPSVQAAVVTADPLPQDTKAAASRIELVGECMVVEPCIDQYLFALYQRTPKEDTIKETEKRKVTVKRKGKMVTVTRSFTKLVENDFTWKDPKAAERVGMSMSDYVIGGMDKSFKIKLFYMLQAAENAGLQPGITSAFRDDYRQSIASGLKAAANRSYHGGSLRGGYGQRACRRHHQRQRRQSRAAMGFDRNALEMGRCERKTVRDRPAVSRLRSTACRPDRRSGICLPPRRIRTERRCEEAPESRPRSARPRPRNARKPPAAAQRQSHPS